MSTSTNTPNNLLPFNWESYQQRTDKDTCVVTRDGRPVKLSGYNPEAQEPYQVIGWVDNMAYEWYPNGSLHGAHYKLNSDIFLKPEAREVYVNVYPDRLGCNMHRLLGAAKEYKDHSGNDALAILRLTYIGNEVKADIVHEYPQPGHE